MKAFLFFSLLLTATSSYAQNQDVSFDKGLAEHPAPFSSQEVYGKNFKVFYKPPTPSFYIKPEDYKNGYNPDNKDSSFTKEWFDFILYYKQFPENADSDAKDKLNGIVF